MMQKFFFLKKKVIQCFHENILSATTTPTTYFNVFWFLYVTPYY